MNFLDLNLRNSNGHVDVKLYDKRNSFPIDKATGNISLICRRFYAEVLVKELGLKGEKSSTYQSVRKKEQSIIRTHTNELKNKFGVETSTVNERLPNIYIGCQNFTNIH